MITDEERREYERERQRRWRQENPEKAKAMWARGRAKRDPEKVREQGRNNWAKHAEKNAERRNAVYANRTAERKVADQDYRRARYQATREERAAKQRDYKERVGDEEMRRRRHAYYMKRRDAHLAKAKEWARNNPDKVREIARAGKKRRPERSAEDTALRRARQAGLPTEPIRRLTAYERDDGWCYLCGYAVDILDFHLDHVIPVCDGGPHLYSNLATTHPICNYRKNRYPA